MSEMSPDLSEGTIDNLRSQVSDLESEVDDLKEELQVVYLALLELDPVSFDGRCQFCHRLLLKSKPLGGHASNCLYMKVKRFFAT
jgi:hypothetical protein